MTAQSDEKKPVVLCVDDEQSILKSLQRLFINTEVDLLLADSGAKALELMRTQRVNVIVTDMRMPNMTGAEFLAQASKLQPDAYRILMTGYADLASTVSAINLGKIHRYIQKPWENKELLAAVDEGLALYRLVRQNKVLTAKVAAQNKQLK
jgi:response regulator RpfG family c-di-GMP phosphodiesterase